MASLYRRCALSEVDERRVRGGREGGVYVALAVSVRVGHPLGWEGALSPHGKDVCVYERESEKHGARGGPRRFYLCHCTVYTSMTQ